MYDELIARCMTELIRRIYRMYSTLQLTGHDGYPVAALYVDILRVIVTPAVYPRLDEFLHFDIQSTGQKSHRVNTDLGHRDAMI